MFKEIMHFIKYNNATVIILAVILILGGGAFAAGPEAIGQRQTSIEGLDNTALLAVDLSTFNMDFKIENIQADEKYYYVTYSFLDLTVIDSAWQYQLSQKTQKVSKKIKEDIGVYMAKFLAKFYEARVRELTEEKTRAQSQGEQKRVEVTEYSGLVGRTLDLAAKVFPGYDPVVKEELPTPENFNLPDNLAGLPPAPATADNLNKIYNDYVATHPEIMNLLDATSTPAQTDIGTTTPGMSEPAPAEEAPLPPTDETPAIPEPESVDIIELPTAEPAPAEITPAPAESTPVEPAPSESAPTQTEPAPIE
jgi:hypothetical protein